MSDMFSCGVIFYVILTGRPLFKGNTPDEILDRNTKCEFHLNDRQWGNVSETAKDLCLKLLKENPDERLCAKDALMHEWFNQTDNVQMQGSISGANMHDFFQQRRRMVLS